MIEKKYFTIVLFTTVLSVFTALVYSGEKKPFPHRPHVLDMEMECKTCHPKIESSTKARDNNIASTKKCADECHDKDIYSAFTLSHSKPENPLEYNHSLHITQDIACKKCHKGLNDKSFTPGKAFPAMKLCFQCHDGSAAAKTCSLCHTQKVRFPHKTHVSGGFSCEDCHTEIKTSVKSHGAPDIPSKKSCNDCHDENEKYADITNFTYGQCYKINHKLHLDDMGMTCKECHPRHYEKNKIKQSKIVVHYSYCLDCHDNETASKNCMLCHVNSTRPESHMIDWSNKHKVQSSENIRECQGCHTKKGFCTKCHSGLPKPYYSHNPNYILTHRYEARTSMQKCSSCHSERYCRNCHTVSGVTKSNRSYRKQHPSGWLNAGSPNFHKRKARLRLTSCTSCHTKNDCSYCHFKRKR